MNTKLFFQAIIKFLLGVFIVGLLVFLSIKNMDNDDLKVFELVNSFLDKYLE